MINKRIRGVAGLALVAGLNWGNPEAIRADVPPTKIIRPEERTEIVRSTRIVNLKEYPDVVVIGFYQGPVVGEGFGAGYIAYRVMEQRLHKGNRANTLSLYWTTADQWAKLDLKKLAVKKENGILIPTDLTMLADKFEPSARPLNLSGRTFESANRPFQEAVEYCLAGKPGENLQLYMSKRTYAFTAKDGNQEKTETFPNPLDRKEPGKKS